MLECSKGSLLGCPPCPCPVLAKQVSKGCSQFCIIADETVIIIAHTQKLLDMLDACKCRPVYYGLHFAGIHANPPLPDNVTQVFYLSLAEVAFGAFNMQLMLAKAGKHGPEVSQMLHLIGTIHKHIIQIYGQKIV